MTTTSKKRRPLWIGSVLGVLSLFGVGVAGCGAHEGPTVSTITPGSGASASAATGEASQLKFSQCMRDQGLTWWPDPGPNGELKVSEPDGTDHAQVEKAQAACKAFDHSDSSDKDEISEADLKKLQAVAQCIRDKGFAKWPDPDANGATRVDSKDLGTAPDDPDLQEAQEECQKYAPARGGNS